MPVVLEESTVDLERLDLSRRASIHRPRGGLIQEPKRTPGVHLSGILRYVALTSGLMRAVQEIDEELLSLRMALGFAWEEFCVSFYPDIAWQPGETTYEDIVMTCDGHSARPVIDDGQVVDHQLCIEEFKCTWKKAKTADGLIREQWYWMQQGRGYCAGYDARLVRWHVCFVNGDYRGSGPIYKRFLIEFSDKDVESTRGMLRTYKDRAQLEGVKA